MNEFFLNFPGEFMFWAIPATLAGLIVLLYFLKLRRAKKTVSSTILWKKSVEDLRVNAPFQRLRKNILLLLQLLILLLLIAAFYRPWMSGSEMKVPAAAILVDNSASMNAKEAGRTRLEIAKEKASALIDTLNENAEGGREIMIISFSNRAKVVQPFSSDVSVLKRALAGVEGTDATTSIDDALSVAMAALIQKPNSAAYVISDGVFPPAAKGRTEKGPRLEFVSVGGPARNIAITAFDVRPSPESFDEFQAFATVENFSAKPFSGPIDISFEGRVIDSAVINVPAGGSVSRTFGDWRLGAGTVSVQIDPKDDLSSDDAAYQLIRPRKKYSVLLVAEGAYNHFIERLFAADPMTEFKVLSLDGWNAEYGPEGGKNFDLVIFDRVSPQRIGAGNFIFMAAVPPINGFKSTGKTEYPRVLFSDEAHPLMSMITFDDVRMKSALDVTLPPGAAVLSEATNGPLAAALFEKDTRVIYIGFDMRESTWWRKSSFPVFMMNALRYMADLSRSL